MDEAEATSRLLERAPQPYIQQSHTERVRLLQILPSNSVLEDGKLDPIYRQPSDLMAEGGSRSSWLRVCDDHQASHGLVIPADLIAAQQELDWD